MAADAELPVRRGAVAVVVREQKFLTIRRSAHVVAPGALCFPGGGIEPLETEQQALVREFREELGADIDPLRLVWRSTTRWQVQLAWWLAVLGCEAPLVANPLEVESFHWLTAEEMLAAENLLESNRTFLELLASGMLSLG